MRFSKKDFISSLVTGLATGIIAWRIAGYLKIPDPTGLAFGWLVIVIPLLWILGVNLGYWLGRRFNFFNQFGKFAAIGFTNAAVDFGVLNLLIAYSGIAAGLWFSVFKTVSFVFGITHSYIWNRYWVFGSDQNDSVVQQFGKFLAVGLMAAAINVTAASLVVNLIGPSFGLSPEIWANVGAVVGSAVALIFSFIGFKMAVFKK